MLTGALARMVQMAWDLPRKSEFSLSDVTSSDFTVTGRFKTAALISIVRELDVGKMPCFPFS